MTLCDRLEAGLVDAATTRSSLLESLLYEELASTEHAVRRVGCPDRSSMTP